MPLSKITGLTIVLLALFVVACSPKPTGLPDGVAPNQVLVLLPPRTVPTALETAFADFSLKAKGPASRTENRYVLTFDPAAIGIDDLLARLRARKDVLEADYLRIASDVN